MNKLARSLAVFALAVFVPTSAVGQQTKRAMDHDVYDTWRSIQGQELSRDGRWILYTLTVPDGDAMLEVRGLEADTRYEIPRGVSAEFDAESRFVAFLIKPEDSLVKQARLDEKKPDEMPKDSLGILDLTSGDVFRAPRVKSFELPEEEGRWIAYHLEEALVAEDSTNNDDSMDRWTPDVSALQQDDDDEDEKKTGTDLILRDLHTGSEEVYTFATEYTLSRSGARLAYAASSSGGEADAVNVIESSTGDGRRVLGGEGSYQGLAFDRAEDQLAFLSNRDDFEADQPAYALFLWRDGSAEARHVAGEGSPGVPDGWWISDGDSPEFSESGARLFFGTSPRPAPEPEETPEWERVELDVWNWRDPLLQPMQLVQRESELSRSYRAVVHLESDRIVQLATHDVPVVRLPEDGEAAFALGESNLPYRQEISWDSPRYADVYSVNVETGDRTLVRRALQGAPDLSPGGAYVTWWDRDVLAWFAAPIAGGEAVNLTGAIAQRFDNEIHDWPYKPNPYGRAGWLDDDAAFVAYDKHDIWIVDPTGTHAPRNVTDGVGRRENLRFRYVRVDPEEEAIPADDPMLLAAFDYETKASGFYRQDVEDGNPPRRLAMMDRRLSAPVKAEDADRFMFTRQSFEEFPDLWVADASMSDMRQVSDANPQQDEYFWGTSELVSWRSTDGQALEGLLFKPENFDPGLEYPMMVYFYEKNSQNLHQYRAPAAGGSSISVSFYVSRGYVVFIPDVYYRVGYPGQSALDCVVPGVLSLLAEGFVDPERVGVQGHSWGGYQISYLVTQTDIFAAAEAGAPVANMTSAYGGIRWGTGMSRMFQYEKTQSRLGGSLWDARPRYIENSPLFWADKIETPVLMMHNDEDTAVPWYQGIEFFVALRRLQKPVWLLNYNGEPHGLRKHQNRIDWQIRMQQFFDHYLKDAPPAVWMVEGVPATQKGRDLGLELVTDPVSSTESQGGSR